MILIVSAGEAASKDVLREVSMLTTSPLLAGSVIDDERHQIVLSNGSQIRAVAASPRQIRGLALDLLVIDESAYVAEDVWTAAKYATIARPESRVVLSSTPWGRILRRRPSRFPIHQGQWERTYSTASAVFRRRVELLRRT
jgi:phage terminase large subunit-like protein